MNIKHIIQNRKLSSFKPLEQRGRWRPGENPLRLVGLILCLEDVSELTLLKELKAFFTGQGATCFTCIYKRNAKMNIPQELIEEDMVVLHRESVNWYGLLRPGYADSFIHVPFDLLVNVSKEYFFTTTYLASAAKATLKIGRYEWPISPYRVVLGAKRSDGDDAFFHLLESSLQLIKFK